MGCTASAPSKPPELLSERSLEGIAEWIVSDVCEENVFVMVRIFRARQTSPRWPGGPALSLHVPWLLARKGAVN